ncbi:lasso peptide biosynthesis PqqD family chaperone [Actinomadura fibrosa]|uniref:Lasso peptide biosynthesis PqqD family chaperone n=1 Tax=Actinomadura fibrosa TaxID=111802 RepID=A0ABW2XUT1_9ACTN|nr:lasso peptide biosynthesis PqqD family chaperone [Actinomadura fibrosa]
MGLRFRAGVATTDTDYGAVLLDERSGDYWQLNPTAAAAVRLLAGGRSVEEAAERLAEEFDVDRSRALSDVQELVEALRSARLVAP